MGLAPVPWMDAGAAPAAVATSQDRDDAGSRQQEVGLNQTANPGGPGAPNAQRPAGRAGFIRAQTDLAAGLFLLIFAGLAWWYGQPLKVGTAYRMGPGYVPMLLAWILGAFGLALVVLGLARRGMPLEAWRPKPIVLVLGSLVMFALTIERTGLLIASVLAVGLAGLAAPQQRLRQTALLALCLAGFACLLFPFALQLPLRILP